MDPKSTTPVLDPKLKEAYDRVMNTPVPPSAHPTTPPIAPPPAPVMPPPPVTPQPAPPPPQPVQPIAPAHEPTTTVHATIPLVTQAKPASATIVATGAKKSGKVGKLFPLLFAIGGLLFFAVYTIFWLKFFNLSVPFLPL